MTASPQAWQSWQSRQAGPWRDADLISVCLTALIGVVMIVAAWFGAAGATSLTQQAAWATLAVGGLVVSGVGLSLVAAAAAPRDRTAQGRPGLARPAGGAGARACTSAARHRVAAAGARRRHAQGARPRLPAGGRQGRRACRAR
ncbi:MAG: hypothetical protein GEU97_00110 [Actinophytocola sp.]|nr:hypothetical protein [Actinophytocola sp.]